MKIKSWSPTSPTLLPTILCFADILGFRGRTDHAFKSGDELNFLRQFKSSLADAYGYIRKVATSTGAEPPDFDMKVFTDNIVIAYPLQNPSRDLGESELRRLFGLLAQVQSGLAAAGFFLRGGITVGQHYQDQDTAFGKALLEAYDLDKSGTPPRLVIGSSLESLIAKHLSRYMSGRAPHRLHLLEDPADGRLFVDYLGAAFDSFPDLQIHFRIIENHSKELRKRLREHESDPRVLTKFTWAANYHNYACSTFASQYPAPAYDDDDREGWFVYSEAQRVLKHLVPESLLGPEQPPLPFDAERLRQRLSEL